jgi:hypothetical protein
MQILPSLTLPFSGSASVGEIGVILVAIIPSGSFTALLLLLNKPSNKIKEEVESKYL